MDSLGRFVAPLLSPLLGLPSTVVAHAIDTAPPLRNDDYPLDRETVDGMQAYLLRRTLREPDLAWRQVVHGIMTLREAAIARPRRVRIAAVLHAITGASPRGCPVVAPELVAQMRADMMSPPDPRPLPCSLPHTWHEQRLAVLAAVRMYHAHWPNVNDAFWNVDDAFWMEYPAAAAAAIAMGVNQRVLWRIVGSQPIAAATALVEGVTTPHLIATAMSKEHAAVRVTRYRPDLRDHPLIRSALTTYPEMAAQVLAASPAHADTSLISVVASNPVAAADLLVTNQGFRTNAQLLASACTTGLSAAIVLSHYADLITDQRFLDAVAAYPIHAARVMIHNPALRRHPLLMKKVAEEAVAAAEVLIHCPECRTETMLIQAAATWARSAAEVLIHCPECRTETMLIQAAATWPQSAAEVLIHCPECRDNDTLIRAVAANSDATAYVIAKCPELCDNLRLSLAHHLSHASRRTWNSVQ